MKKLILPLVIITIITACAGNNNINKYENISTFRDNVKMDLKNYKVLYFESLTEMNEKKLASYSKNCDCIIYTIGRSDGTVGNLIQKGASKITPSSGMRKAGDVLVNINSKFKDKDFLLVVPSNYWYFEGTLRAIELKKQNLSNLKGYVWLMTDDKQELIEKRIEVLSSGNLKIKYGKYLENNK